MKEKFIMLGQKEKGKIVKNEMYSLIEFNDILEKIQHKFEGTKLTFWERLRKKKADKYAAEYRFYIIHSLSSMIEKDKKGKK